MKLTHKKTQNHHVNLNTRAILTFFQQIISFIYGKTSAAVELIFATLQGAWLWPARICMMLKLMMILSFLYRIFT